MTTIVLRAELTDAADLRLCESCGANQQAVALFGDDVRLGTAYFCPRCDIPEGSDG